MTITDLPTPAQLRDLAARSNPSPPRSTTRRRACAAPRTGRRAGWRRDPHGNEMPLCAGHTLDARTVLPIDTAYTPTTEGARP